MQPALEKEKVNSVTFNQSYSYLCVATNVGLRVFQLKPFKQLIWRVFDFGI